MMMQLRTHFPLQTQLHLALTWPSSLIQNLMMRAIPTVLWLLSGINPQKKSPASVPPLVSEPPSAVDAAKVVNLPIPIPSGFDHGAHEIYIDGKGSSETVVYEGDMSYCLNHTI
jgi:hypothetical protein